MNMADYKCMLPVFKRVIANSSTPFGAVRFLNGDLDRVRTCANTRDCLIDCYRVGRHTGDYLLAMPICGL